MTQLLAKMANWKFILPSLLAFIYCLYLFQVYGEQLNKPKKNQFEDDKFYASYKQWQTHQMSDHLPLWVELKIDYTDEYLQHKLDGFPQ